MTVLDRLLTDNRAYRRHLHKHEYRQHADLAAHGQAPTALVVGCCDSRVAPETLLEAPPGRLFTLRSIAALVAPPDRPDGTHAAVAYAVAHLGVAAIVVCGHSQCGGVAAARTGEPLGEPCLDPWLDHLRRGSRAPRFHACTDSASAEAEAVRQSLDNLAALPAVAARWRTGQLELAGAHYDIASAALTAVPYAP